VSHTQKDREKLLNRIKKIRGQLNAAEKAVLLEEDCAAILGTLASCRGALNGLMTELLEDHVRFHIVDPAKKPNSKQAAAAQELLDVLRMYIK
jgi:DNA-binding FrmR family transcriptional regulator